MIHWFIDKNNKVPLYLQLKDLIQYYISTGAIQDQEPLPGVYKLARELSVNFETVRKAYKELEKEGFVVIKKATGTFATLPKSAVPSARIPERRGGPAGNFVAAVTALVQDGKTREEITALLERTIGEIELAQSRRYVVFTECNLLQVHDISELLRDYLKIEVRPVILQDLGSVIREIPQGGKELLAIVTTGFHVQEVRRLAGTLPVDIHILITNMSPETRRRTDQFKKGSRFGFICRDKESIPLYKDLLRADLGRDLDLLTAWNDDERAVHDVLKSVDVLFVTPPVYKDIKKMAPAGLPVFNVFDRIEPMSLRLLKDLIVQKLQERVSET